MPGPIDGWRALVAALGEAGERLAADTADLPPEEQADAFRSLVRGLGNQLGRFETDRERPELVPFNGWRQKMFMDNPDFRYWVADITGDRAYRIRGTVGDAAYVSVTVYTTSGPLEAVATARIDSDELAVGPDGTFELIVAPEAPSDGATWLPAPEGPGAVWIRHFHDDVHQETLGWCSIEPLDDPGPAPRLQPARLARQLGRLGRAATLLPAVWRGAMTEDLARPNEIRHWTEMVGGAAFTEPNIGYLRGGWQLGADEALVIEGDLCPCRYWNVLLYSRFLNSLDHRSRPVSLTGHRARVDGGRYRLVLAAQAPPEGHGPWLDTEGRSTGIVVFRFLHPEGEPPLPQATVVRLADLAAGG